VPDLRFPLTSYSPFIALTIWGGKSFYQELLHATRESGLESKSASFGRSTVGSLGLRCPGALALRLSIAASLLAGTITLVPAAGGIQGLSTAEDLHNRGVALFKEGRYEQAAEFFIKATELAPRWAEAHNDLGMTYKRLGRLDQAIEAFKLAISVSPDYSLAYFNLAGTYRELGRYEESVAAYQRALNIDPNYPAAYNNLGVTYDLMGHYEDAAKAYLEAIRLEPNLVEAVKL
jgi:tetratricopeptide (TPR) repeat protein